MKKIKTLSGTKEIKFQALADDVIDITEEEDAYASNIIHQ